MLITNLKEYKTTTKVVVKCDECGEEHETVYYIWLNSKIRAKYGKDFCVKCRYKDGRCPAKNKQWYYDPLTLESFFIDEKDKKENYIKGNINVVGKNNPMSRESLAEKNNCSLEDAKKYNPFYGKKHSDETINKISRKNKEKANLLTKEERRQKYGCGIGLQIKGKTNKEFYGDKKAKEMLHNQKIGYEKFINSMTFEELKQHFENKARSISKTLLKNESLSGDKNPSSRLSVSKRFGVSIDEAYKYMPMYGKTHTEENRKIFALTHFGKSPSKNSGFGFSGAYKGFNFRSSYELSFLIDILKYDIIIEDAESRFNIQYKLNNKNRTYRPDFLINKNILIEIKPQKLTNSDENIAKFEAANKFCEQNNLKFVILTEKDLTLIKKQDIINMYKNKEIILFKNTLKRLGLNE